MVNLRYPSVASGDALVEHGGDPSQIEATAMDMRPAYVKGATEYFPGARIVFDKFHVMVLGRRSTRSGPLRASARGSQNPHQLPRANQINKEDFTLMRHLLLCSLDALARFGIFGLPQTSAAPTPDQSDKPDFSGNWTLDPKASASLESLIKKIGGSLVEQKFDSWANVKATIQQTQQVITVATRGPGFA